MVGNSFHYLRLTSFPSPLSSFTFVDTTNLSSSLSIAVSIFFQVEAQGLPSSGAQLGYIFSLKNGLKRQKKIK